MEPWIDFCLKEIEAHSKKLSDWERVFIFGDHKTPGIKQRIEMGFQLSSKQIERLNLIHEKVTDVRRQFFKR